MEAEIKIPIHLTVEQAEILYTMLQHTIKATQLLMRAHPEIDREVLRQRIIRMQDMRRQIPDFIRKE